MCRPGYEQHDAHYEHPDRKGQPQRPPDDRDDEHRQTDQVAGHRDPRREDATAQDDRGGGEDEDRLHPGPTTRCRVAPSPPASDAEDGLTSTASSAVIAIAGDAMAAAPTSETVTCKMPYPRNTVAKN